MYQISMQKIFLLLTGLFLLTACSPVTDADNENKSKQKPVAIIASPDQEQFILVGDEINFVGHGSFDPNGNVPLIYSWAFTGAATSERESSLHNPPIRFTEAGVATATLVVTNNVGVSSEPDTVTINVNTAATNRAPDGTINYSIDNGALGTGDFSITTNSTVVFSGSAIDPDSDPVNTFVWTIPTGVVVSETLGDVPFNATFPTAGTYILSLTVTDDLGNADLTPAQIAVSVTDSPNNPVNLAPDGTINHNKGGSGNLSITAGDEVIFNGTATDPEANLPITYNWDFGVSTTTTTLEDPITVKYPTQGTFIVKLTVTDSLANIDPTPAEITVTVLPVNQPPNGIIKHDSAAGTGLGGIINSTGNISITAGDDIVFKGEATDPESDPISSFTWNFAGMNATSTSGKDPILVNYPSAGTFLVRLVVRDNSGNVDPSPAEIIVTVLAANQAPNGTIQHDNGSGGIADKTGNISINSNQSVIFIGSGTDPEGDALSYKWNFNGMSATPGTAVAGPITVTYPSTGTFIVNLTVTDSNNLADPIPAQITVTVADVAVNLPPDGFINHDNGNNTPNSTGNVSIYTSGSIIFSGTATDPEGDSVSYEWNFGTAATVTNGNINSSGPITVDYPTAGSFIATLTVTDANGNIDLAPAQIAVTVSDNLAPNGFLTYTNSNVTGTVENTANVNITINDSLTFTGSSTDPESDTVSLAWDFGVSAPPGSGVAPGTVIFPNAGTFEVILTATDSVGNIDPVPAHLTVNVSPVNQAPDGLIKHNNASGSTEADPITNVGDVTITAGDTIIFKAEATDPEGNMILYSWDFGVNAPTNAGPGPISVTYPGTGTFVASLTVRDSLGNTDPSPAFVTVKVDPVNLPPNGTISHDKGVGDVSIFAGESIVFTGAATDPEGNLPITYDWDFGVSTTTTMLENPITITYPDTGTYVVTLTVKDSLNNIDQTPATMTVTVDPNPAPNGTISHDKGIGNININAGETVVFRGATDPVSNLALTYNWSFGATIPSQTGQVVSVNYPDAGTYNVTLAVSDSMGGVDPTPAVLTVTVAPNPAPNGTISHDQGAGNININAGDTVVFSGATDPISNLAITYNWDFGATIPSQTGQVVSVNYPDAGIYNVTLAVSDSMGGVDPTPAVLSVTVNQAPNGSISHNIGSGTDNISINVNDSITFSGSATDLESNFPLSYAWDFGSVALPSTAQTVTINYPDAGTFDAFLTVTDSVGNVDKTPAKITVTVINLPPDGTIQIDDGTGTGTLTTVSALEVSVGDIVAFYGSGSDPESDAMGATWDFGGATAGSTSGFATKSVQFTAVGTNVITLTVFDAYGSDPTPATVVVTVVQNLAPFGSAITHDRNCVGAVNCSGNISMIAGGSVTVNFSGSATDPEGFPLTYRWDFGVSTRLTQNSAPITINYPNPGTYQVQFTAVDDKGLDDPVPATLTVTVVRQLPVFKNLPVLPPSGINPLTGETTYTISADNNVKVNIVTPDESWVTPMMRYNSLQLSPVIVARRGTPMIFNVTNNLGVATEETTVHWHGFKIPGIQDGGPDAPFAPGTSKTYSFTLNQPAAPLWFHPHAHGTTATQVYKGLAGAFVIKDDITDTLENPNTQGIRQLPTGNYDIPLMIQDRLFSATLVAGERALVYQGTMTGMGAGMLGDTVLVNGVQLPGLQVDTRQYRFRLYNGSNARTYDFALDNNAAFMVVGTDGGLLNNPVQTNHIKLGAGERAEIVVDFGAYTVGEAIMLVSRTFNDGNMGGMGGGVQNGAYLEIMRFDVSTPSTDDVELYTSLPGNPEINTRWTTGDVIRPFEMSQVFLPPPGGGFEFRINDLTYLSTRVDELVPVGATEIWNITNISNMAHPFHAHAIQWQILSRGQVDSNGIQIGTNTAASGIDLGWKDTVLVQPGESVQFIGRFDPVINVGFYMYHCHILEHEDNGMMGTFEIR